MAEDIIRLPVHAREFQPLYTEQSGILAGIFFAYLVSARIGLDINAAEIFTALVWLPSGIAFAAFLLYGRRIWPAVFFAAFLASASLGASLLAALGIAVGNTIGPALGALFTRWYSRHASSATQLRDNIGIVISALIVPCIIATIGVGSLWLGGNASLGTLGATWEAWWIGDALGILILTPFLLVWLQRPLFEKTLLQWIEFLLVLGAVAGTSFLVFWTPITHYAYYLFVPLTWAALRTGPRGATLSIVAASGIGVFGTLSGHGPFALNTLDMQGFLATMAVVTLIFAITVEERRRTLEMLERHVDELEVALHKISSEDEAKKEFLAVLAHELRNPLATILSSIELLNLQGAHASNEALIFETIDERSRAMVRLLDDILDVARISQKKLKLQKEIIALDQFVNKLAYTTQPIMRKYGHTLSITKPSEELYLSADPGRLEQIFANLLTNAAKYTRAPGAIEFIVRREGSMAAIHIRDSGVGIPKNMLQRIFEPFFQIDRSQMGAAEQGIGIGLPLTRQLVEMHGGIVEAKSGGTDAGSEFVVRLPLHMSPVAPLSVPIAGIRRHMRTPRKVKRTFKILLVDDNETATGALARMLELRGHTIALAYTGSEAIRKALTFGPDIVILDIGLPDIDGYEVARILRAQNKSYFIIALTGYGQADDKERAKQAGFQYHLTKPAGFKDIEAVLRKAPRTAKESLHA